MPLLKELACGRHISDAELYFGIIALDNVEEDAIGLLILEKENCYTAPNSLTAFVYVGGYP